jgi:hypothetical protein
MGPDLLRSIHELFIVEKRVPQRHHEAGTDRSAMTQQRLDQWLQALGYDPASRSVHRASAELVARHPYAPELHDLLNPTGDICAEVVFDVEGQPTVGFFLDDGSLLTDDRRLADLRQKVWNQGLISVLLVVRDDEIVPVPVAPRRKPGAALRLADARRDGPLSKADIQSGDIRDRYPEWFNLEERVDRKLLANLRHTVNRLSRLHLDAPGANRLSREQAQYLVGQVLFVSYLEHRGIVGARYRQSRGVGQLLDLVSSHDRAGMVRLFDRLKHDFNGDFLESEQAATSMWAGLADNGYSAVHELLAATDVERRQPSFFPYNFRFIPVELLSGVYESFLGRDDKDKLAAYYTPRNLANLVVDQALAGSKDLLAEKIFDGACGSGILLTTAFRRLLGEAEARRGGARISLRDRIEMLRGHIFGSDLSEAACRVTAFSLYLSLLERLEPSDIVALCEDENVKLPTLRGSNLFSGSERGDFFSPHNPNGQRRDYTLLLSNPPWMELGSDESAWVDNWAAQAGHPRTLKQIAADFAWRATEIAAPGARLCLILPMTLMLKPTSQAFLAAWLERVKLHRAINFGDLKELLFAEGRASCIVLLAERREPQFEDGSAPIPGRETFDYWVPKADVSLAFGRLTLHGTDRHVVQTQAIARSNRELVTRMWGDDFDLALWSRLCLRGTFKEMFEGRNARWGKRKGFHRTDNSAHARKTSSEPLHRMPFVRPEMLYDVPVIRADEAQAFPRQDMPVVYGDVDELMDVFTGPRILFPDGPDPKGTIRAAYIDRPASFMSSIGVIAGPHADEDLLRFAAIYLRSDLVRYFAMTQLYQLLSDRDRVSLRDIAAFPFYPPKRHAQPERAQSIVREVAAISRSLEHVPALERVHVWERRKPELDELIEEYFELEGDDRAVVRETVELLRDTVRPYGLKAVFEIARRRVDDAMAKRYAGALMRELEAWRDARGGEGEFTVSVRMTNVARAGAYGIVSIRVGEERTGRIDTTRSDAAVDEVIRGLFERDLLPLAAREHIYLAADTVLVDGDTVHVVKPQAQRLWLLRQARRDAERIVQATLAPEASERVAA